MPRSDPKQEIALWLAMMAPGAFVEEYRFHPTRRWKIDWAAPTLRLGLEYEGGVFHAAGGHRATGKFLRDLEKYSVAAAMGWRIIRCTAREVESGQVFEWLTMALEERAA